MEAVASVWLFLVLSATLRLFTFTEALTREALLFVAAADSSLLDEGKALRPREAPENSGAFQRAPEASAPPEAKIALPLVQDFCGGPEDLRQCDVVRDGVCIISATYLRLWQRRRWRHGSPPEGLPEPRWVEGLRIRTAGDISVEGAVIECTQAAPPWGRGGSRRRRIPTRGPLGTRKFRTPRGPLWGGPPSNEAPVQRIELCASGSIRLVGAARLHCTETILLAGDSVTVAEKAEVTATATVMLRGPHELPAKTKTVAYDSALGAPGGPSLESIATRLSAALGVGGKGRAPEQNPGKGNLSGAQAVFDMSPLSSSLDVAGREQRKRDPKEGPLQAPSPEPQLRGGSYGGLGGVATDRCEAKAFSNPVRAPLDSRGNVFLPLDKGEAGRVYLSPMGAPPRGSLTALPQRSSGPPSPRGGGLVVIIALRRLAVEGQVTSSGEPGWGCEGDLGSADGAPQSPSAEEPPKETARGWRFYRRIAALFRSLLLAPGTGALAAGASRPMGPAAATCATAGSGGSIVLVSESLSFSTPIQTGRVTAAGGGCQSAPPVLGRKRGVGLKGSRGAPQQSPEAQPGECAAGGGGRIAIYADQPHPLDPVVLAPGGCASRSSRLDLLPCLCGGGGTIFSRVHRRLVIANKLTVVTAGAAASPTSVSLEARSQTTTPHTTQIQQSTDDSVGSRRQLESEKQARGGSQGMLPPEGPVSGGPSGLDTLAVLSVQPTPLPVPLHAPTITLAVEAAVVTFGGLSEDSVARAPVYPNLRGPQPRPDGREPKVVVGSLLLHGGSRESSIRLRQRSALVLAPCGSSETEETASPCRPERLPLAGLLLGASVVVSSAASVSVGESAAIRLMPGPSSCQYAGAPMATMPPPQQGPSERTGSALGVALLAGDRLLLHGTLGLATAPSDYLPAPLRKTPLLLFGGREVSVRGEQQLDRLVILSQGTASLGGTCTVGDPHRCNAQRTLLAPSSPNVLKGPIQHSSVCSALQGYASAYVAPRLRAAGEVSQPFFPHITKGLHPEDGVPPSTGEDGADAHTNEKEAPAASEGGGDSDSPTQLDGRRPSLSERTEKEQRRNMANAQGWVKRIVKAFRRLASNNNQPTAAHSVGGPTVRQTKLQEGPVKERQRNGRPVAFGPPHLRSATVAEWEVQLDAIDGLERQQTLGGPHLVRSLRRKRKGPRWGLFPLLGPLVPGSLLGPWRSPGDTPNRERDSPADSTPQTTEAITFLGLQPIWEAPRQRSHLRVPQAEAAEDPAPLKVGPTEDSAADQAVGTEELPGPATSFSPPPLGGGGGGPVLGYGSIPPGLGGIEGVLQGRTLPWGHLDAAIFARDGLVLDSGASLIGGAVLLCGGSGNTVLQGIVDATRRGCQPTHGPGAGSRGADVEAPASGKEPASPSSLGAHSSLCGGGGGAHVGSGGDGVHALTRRPCKGSGGLAYDRGPPTVLREKHYPRDTASAAVAAEPVPLAELSPEEAPQLRGAPGSQEGTTPAGEVGTYASTASASGGGGDPARAGSGGGFVWVQGQTVTVDGMILADGGGGELMQDAIIDVEVDRESCAMAPPILEAPRGTQEGADSTPGEWLPEKRQQAKPNTVQASSLSVPGHDSDKTVYVAYARGSLSPEVLAKGDVLPGGANGEALRVAEAEGGGAVEEAPTRASVSCQLSGILSDPAQLGQGGGGGGSVVIETSALLGTGVISAQGGPGGRCTGGGGGGGAIDFLWTPSLHRIRGQVPQQPHAPTCRNSVKRMICKGHKGLCVDPSKPLIKESGAQDGRDVFIPWIRPLGFAAGFSGALRVRGGGRDPSPVCGPLQLPLGQEGAPGEVRSLMGCPPGYSGWRCIPCPAGYYSLGERAPCLSCSNKPSDDAFYTREGVGGPQCPYACAAGLPSASVNPKCLPPFLFILDQLLCVGMLVFLGILCLALLSVGTLLRELACRRGQQGWGYGALLGAPGSPAPVVVSRMESASPTSGFGVVQPSPSGSLGFLGGSKERRLLHLAVHHLTLEDLPFHVFRIYLHGRNSPHSPWGLDGQTPLFLDPLITPRRFAAFAEAANALCGFSRCFVLTYGLLSSLYPPLAALLLRTARARRADKMVAFCNNFAGGPSGTAEGGPQFASWWGMRGSWYSLALRLGWGIGSSVSNREGSGVCAAASFWRGIRARELSFALKFGCDPDCTLGFIDVLDLDRNILDYRCSPQLPLVLLTQGDGRLVPFSLTRGLREPRDHRESQGFRPTDGNRAPADPLQGALEELASPSVWACLEEFFSAKVKEITAEDLEALRALVATGPNAGNCGPYCGDPQVAREWVGGSTFRGPLKSAQADERAAHPFSRCGRCGRLQLLGVGTGGSSEGPFGMLMCGPLYAMRAVARLCEGIHLLSSRLLKPHGIAASVCLLPSRGLVSRADGVRRVAGDPSEAREAPRPCHRDSSTTSLHRPLAGPDNKVARRSRPPLAIGREGHPSGAVVPPELRGTLGTGRLLLRAASTPSALFDSFRGNGGGPSLSQQTSEGALETKGRETISGSDSVGGLVKSRLGLEQRQSTALLEALETVPQQGCTDQWVYAWEGGTASVESEAVLALVITEDAPEADGEGLQATPRTAEQRPMEAANGQGVIVPCFPPISSQAVTSPLDPLRLSPLNRPLAPYTAAGAPALQKSNPYWGSGGPPIPNYSSVPGGPSSLLQSFDRTVGHSPLQNMPSGFRGARRVWGSFNDASSPEPHGSGAVSPQGSLLGAPADGSGVSCGAEGGPMMCLADTAKRSAGADAQHLRDAVEALQKSALAKLGTGPEGAGTASTPEEPVGFSMSTTLGAAETEAEGEGPTPRDTEDAEGPGVIPQPLTLLRLALRRLRFRSSSTDLARTYIFAATLAVHILHMAATGVYLFGLKNTSFAVAWPQTFPSIVQATESTLAWTLPVNAFLFRGEDAQAADAAAPLFISPPLQGPGVGPAPVANAVAKWAGLAHSLGGPSWGLLALALSVPPLADLLCALVGFWFILADTRQEQLFCMAVAATMPKHIVVYLFLVVCGTSLRVAVFGFLEILSMAVIKVFLCTLAAMFASRSESPDSTLDVATKESVLLKSIVQECEQAADICSCHPFEGCT